MSRKHCEEMIENYLCGVRIPDGIGKEMLPDDQRHVQCLSEASITLTLYIIEAYSRAAFKQRLSTTGAEHCVMRIANICLSLVKLHRDR